MNSYLEKDNKILTQTQLTKIEIINKIYNEITIKMMDEKNFNKYSEIFFSLKELEHINIVKLIKNGEFKKSRHEYCRSVKRFNLFKITFNF